MPTSTAVSLAVIASVAVLAPIIAELLWRLKIPSVLLEILLGILVGPSILSWAKVDPFISSLSGLGLSFLFFLAGFEIDFERLKGKPLSRGTIGWGVSLAAGLSIGLALMLTGFVLSSLLIGLALTTTAIGTLMPILKDRQVLATPFGTLLTAAGAIGEFGPIIAVTVLLGTRKPGVQTLLLASFIILAVGVASLASRPQPPALVATLQRHLNTSTQLPVRIIILLIAVMVAIASRFGLDLLLGAFSAGLIARLAIQPPQTEFLVPKLEAVGFGFLIPVFFIVSGMKFDVSALWNDPATIIHALIFFALFLVIRGAPALLIYRGIIPMKQRVALGVLQSTALPMLVVIVEIGLSTQTMRPVNGTALITAGMLSVLVFPLVGFGMLDHLGIGTDGSGSWGSSARADLTRTMVFDDEAAPEIGS